MVWTMDKHVPILWIKNCTGCGKKVSRRRPNVFDRILSNRSEFWSEILYFYYCLLPCNRVKGHFIIYNYRWKLLERGIIFALQKTSSFKQHAQSANQIHCEYSKYPPPALSHLPLNFNQLMKFLTALLVGPCRSACLSSATDFGSGQNLR